MVEFSRMSIFEVTVVSLIDIMKESYKWHVEDLEVASWLVECELPQKTEDRGSLGEGVESELRQD